MSELKPTSGEQEESSVLTLEWYGQTQEAIMDYIKEVFSEERRKDLTFREKMKYTVPQIMEVSSMIYDLGHAGRGVDDFPESIDIPLGEGARESKTVIYMSAEYFLRQLKSQIVGFLEHHAIRSYEPDIYKSQIGYLYELYEYCYLDTTKIQWDSMEIQWDSLVLHCILFTFLDVC